MTRPPQFVAPSTWLNAARPRSSQLTKPVAYPTPSIRPVIGLRDRALIGVMVYSFARVGATVTMKVEDLYAESKRWWLRLYEKGGKRHKVPAHHNADEYLDAYLNAAGISDESGLHSSAASTEVGE